MIQQLQQGTREVVKVMEESQSKTDDSVQHATQAAQALETITQAVSVINDMNTQIASAAEEQSAVAEDINRNVTNIGQVANEVAGGADEVQPGQRPTDQAGRTAAPADQSVQGMRHCISAGAAPRYVRPKLRLQCCTGSSRRQALRRIQLRVVDQRCQRALTQGNLRLGQ